MTERIDHAAEARRKMRVTAELLMHEGDELHAIGNTLEAQVHATLALVEQQRIANLITVADLWTTPEIVSPIVAEIREALGLP